MKIPLDQFEQVIDEKILVRGLSYYKKGNVHDLEETSPGCYETIVEGTENYNVQLTVNNGAVTEYSCDCPYDFGPVCKHVAAALFKLQEDTLGLAATNKSKGTSKPRGKNMATQIKEMLSKATKEELEQFLNEEAKNNAELRTYIVSAFDHYNDHITSDNYLTIINNLVKKATGRYGFIEWSAANKLGRDVDELIENAHKHVKSQNYAKALPIIFAVIEGMSEPLNNSDDSSGSIGGCIAGAFNLLEQVAKECTQHKIRRTIFEACIEYFKQDLYKGFDWYRDLMSIAASLVDNDDDFNTVAAFLDKEYDYEFTTQEFQTVKYNLLKRYKGDTEAAKYLEANLSNSDLREKAIELSINNKDFDRAEQLANDGIEQDKEDKPGLVSTWNEWLLKSAQAQHDRGKIVKCARQRLLDNFQPQQDYYKILKDNVDPQQWPSFFDALINEPNKSKHFSATTIADLYIKEEMWDRLFALVKENQYFSFIEHYEKYLDDKYSNQIAVMYADLILASMERNMGRNHYQESCRYLRRMIKLGARAKADEVIETLRSLYPKRRALMEELEKV